MNLGVGPRVGRLVAAAAMMLAATAGGGSARDTTAPKIRSCADRYCRSSESSLFVQDPTFVDGTRHFTRALEAIGVARLDACRIQNPGYATNILLSIRPQLSTRTWLVEAKAYYQYDRRLAALANQAVARCFQQLFDRYINSDLVSPEAIDAWRDTNWYIQTR